MLNASEKKVYQYLVNYITDNLYPPTLEEISKATGFRSKSTVSDILKNLKDAGLIRLKSNSSRAIALVGYKLIRTDVQ